MIARAIGSEQGEPPISPVEPAMLGIHGAETATFSTLLQDGTELTVGLPIESSSLNKVVRRVILVATTLATFYVLYFVFNLLRACSLEQVQTTGRCKSSLYASDDANDPTSLWAAVSSLLIELSIPACGYFGAMYNNRQMTCCFCSCNLFIAILSAMTMIRTSVRISDVGGQCEREQNVQHRRTCEIWASDGVEKHVMIFHNIVVILMGFLAFWFGNHLYNKLAHDYSLTPAPVVGEVIATSVVRDMMDTSNGRASEQGARDLNNMAAEPPEPADTRIEMA